MARARLPREIELNVNRIANDRAIALSIGRKDCVRYRRAYLEHKAHLLAKVVIWAAAGDSEEVILQRLGADQRAKHAVLMKTVKEATKRLMGME